MSKKYLTVYGFKYSTVCSVDDAVLICEKGLKYAPGVALGCDALFRISTSNFHYNLFRWILLLFQKLL